MTIRKIGLALGGGAARGLAHIGVLQVLEQEGIPIDMISGTSMGAIVGAFYSYTRDLVLMKNLAIELGKKRLRLFTDITIPRTGILSWRKVEKELHNYIGRVNFDDLKIPFACVAVDIDNGEECILNTGLVWDAVRASASVPVMLPLTKVSGRHLVDGGILDPVPVRLVKSMGAEFVIAVNVLPRLSAREPKSHTIVSILLKTIYISNVKVIEVSLHGADVVVTTDMESIGYTDFHKAEECINKGREAARLVIPEIKRKLALGLFR